MNWWEHGYPGGPMVPVPGFPRPLYFPGNPAGHPASPDGPDVEAYKRTVSRAGRWPWQRFDQAYSKQFAVGKPGGNVADTGVAGVQRQLGIEDTGYVGKATFNGLRSIRIPDGLPHAGEPAMDVSAQNLVGEAWQMFDQELDDDHVAVSVRELALAGATGWLGYTESPPGTNKTKFGAWYGADYQPWCAMFVTYCFDVEAPGSPSFERGQRYAYVPYVVADARAGRNGLSVTGQPMPGDLVCFDWEGDGTPDHIGIFEHGTPSSFTSIEGNTSTSSDSNGGQTMRRNRSTNQAAITFVRVAEP